MVPRLGMFELMIWSPGSQTNNDDTYNVRIDERLNANNSLFFRYTRMNYLEQTPDTNKLTSEAIEHPVNDAAGFTHIFTPNLLTDLHFGFAKLNSRARRLTQRRNSLDSVSRLCKLGEPRLSHLWYRRTERHWRKRFPRHAGP